MEFPEDPASKNAPFNEETLDHTPLKFGKFKGQTPDKIAQTTDGSYLVWAYENVQGFDVCSHALYKDCGGTGSREARAKPETDFHKRNRSDYRNVDAATGEVTTPNDRYDSRASTPAKPQPSGDIDDYNDDIPF